MLTFRVGEAEGTVNEEAKTVSVVLPFDSDADLTKIAPEITISEKAAVSPQSGAAQDFSDGKEVVYTVTSESGKTAEYKATVKKEEAVTISFDTDNGTPIDPVKIKKGEIYTPETTVEKTADDGCIYLFEGWYTDAERQTKYEPAAAESDMTLYAKFEKAAKSVRCQIRCMACIHKVLPSGRALLPNWMILERLLLQIL